MMAGENKGVLMTKLDKTTIEAWARQALSNIDHEFPNATQHLTQGVDDPSRPSELHPAFYGSYDWHSSVHMHWLLVRTLRHDLSDGLRDQVIEALNRHLSRANLEAEAAYLKSNPSFEQPYGWAWLLMLQAEVRRLRDGQGEPGLDAAVAGWDDALAAITDVLTAAIRHWLNTNPFPIRHGVHANSAFALILFRAGAAVLDDSLHADVDQAAREWFAHDHDAPVHWEPSGHDFLSPALTEAYLMSRVLDTTEFRQWFTGFIPIHALDTGTQLTWLEPPQVKDVSDGRQGHLYGLAMTRAWQLPQILAALQPDDRRADSDSNSHEDVTAAYQDVFLPAAQRNLEYGLAALQGDNFVHNHWLATFAYLALVQPI